MSPFSGTVSAELGQKKEATATGDQALEDSRFCSGGDCVLCSGLEEVAGAPKTKISLTSWSMRA